MLYAMDTMNDFDFGTDPLCAFIGLELVTAGNDTAVLRLKPSENLASGIGGSVHGGVLATLLDNAAVAAVWSNLRGAIPGGTADLQITYLRKAHGELKAEARVIKRGRQLCTVNVDITDSEGLLCASGRVLYAVRTA